MKSKTQQQQKIGKEHEKEYKKDMENENAKENKKGK